MTLFDDLKVLFTKTGKIDDKIQPYIINRFLSFHGGTLGVARRLNRHIFWLDRDLILAVMDISIPKQRTPFFHYIKKQGELVDEEFDFLLKPMIKYFHWTDKDYRTMYPLLKKLLRSKEFLYDAMCFFGSDESKFEKYNLKFKEKEAIECQNLEKWSQ